MSAERIRSQVQKNTSGRGKGLNRGIGYKIAIALLALIPFVNSAIAQETEKARKPDAPPAMKEKGKPGLDAIRAGAGRGDKKAIRQLKVLAGRGNAKAQILLGDLYLDGKGVPKNGSLAGTWYQRAAEKGNAEGQYKIAIIYLNGVHLPLDPEEAGNWLEKAAQQGHADAREALVRLGRTPPPVIKPKK